MFTAHRSVQAVVILLLASFCTPPAFSQSAQFPSSEARSLRLHSPSLPASSCSDSAVRSFSTPSGPALADSPLPPCDRSLSSTPKVQPAAVTPCNLSTQAAIPCSASRDIVRDDLNTMGKQGHNILRARDKVLEILHSENACTDWYRTKSADPAAVFRTLTFALDRDGDLYVHRIPAGDGIELIRNPYVARVLQGEGLNSTVTINMNGAFFFPLANVLDDRFEGGPIIFRSARTIQVGPYSGGSFHAQVLALLHEFGHVIDLLPQDQGDYEGKSRHNTEEVLRFCRAEVESREAPRTFLASR